MRKLATLIITCALAVAGCGTDGEQSSEEPGGTAQSSKSNTRGGTVTVGEQSWTFVPSIQCSIYPGNVVSIAGHAAEDPMLEITIDYDAERGPVQVVVGTDGRDGSWFAKRDTLRIEIEGRNFSGTATFTEFRGGAGQTASGSFNIDC